ncbi:RNA exonuclease 1 homolog [Varroa jacobsoni]|uniref:RNA exonuclease 1 homolog n=1 Tax=Varroa jacobsoni TaxID=62625 RepID=UPI000BF3E81D|nr:RNA exonuclease 1 homolog [Varroa jacobsoni]XP_022688948.1 RNA exonuclease 1 homolog [Varroa jacobsoni]XP_022689757.1 RNA exonuclease 1 homolog [Varroa jacobsoni]
MFRSQGRLSGVVCPLHVVGQCNRPYCHFKHSPSVPQQQAPLGGSEPAGAESSPKTSDIVASGSIPTNLQQPPKRPLEPAKPARSHIPAIRVPQYRPTPIAVLQRRHQNAATNAARVLSTEAGKVPAVGVDTYSTHQFAKADETRVIEPAFSEDEDDEEEAILMEIFQKGVMGESAEQQSNAHPMGQLDDDRLKEPQRFEKRRHKEEETPNDFVIDLTEGDDYDASTTKKYDNEEMSKKKQSYRDEAKYLKRRLSSSSPKREDSLSLIGSSRSKDEGHSSSSSTSTASRKRHSSDATEHDYKSRSTGSSNGHDRDQSSKESPFSSVSLLTEKDRLNGAKEKQHRKSNESAAEDSNEVDNRSSSSKDHEKSSSRSKDRRRNKSRHSSSSKDRDRDKEKDQIKDRDRDKSKDKRKSSSSSSSSSKDTRLSSSSSKEKSSSSNSSSHSKDTEQKRSTKHKTSNGFHSDKKEDSGNKKSGSSHREEKNHSKTSGVSISKRKSWGEHQGGYSDSGARSDDSARDHGDGGGSSSSEGRGSHRRTSTSADDRSKRVKIEPGVIAVGDIDINDVDLSDEDPEQECLRLFQECESQMSLNKDNNGPAKTTQDSSLPVSVSEPSKVIDMVGVTRKRIAHDPGARLVATVPPVPKKPFRPSPAQQLVMRQEAMQRARLKQQNSSNETQATPIFHPTTPTEQRRQRICTVSTDLVAAVAQRKNLALASAKARQVGIGADAAAGRSSTGAQVIKRIANTVPLPHATNHVQTKGVARVAHVAKALGPSDNPVAPPRPRIQFDSNMKVPVNLRQLSLDKLIDLNNMICTTYEESYEKSLNEERDVCGRAKDRRVYSNLVANLIMRLKKESGELGPSSTAPQAVSHADVLGGAKAKKMSFSIEKHRFRRNTSVDNMTEEQFYEHMREKYLMKSTELDQMGFPRPCEGKPGKAEFRHEAALSAPPDPRTGNERTCVRCKKVYFVDRDGMYLRHEECVYHWGKNWMRHVKRSNVREQQYTCCDAESGSDGCSVAKGHVFDNPILKEDGGYMTTLTPEPAAANNFKKVYALDCEMIYTTRGTELARVSMVDMNLRTIYETKVKPRNPVLDYNTRFSGLKMEDLESVTTELHEVQAAMLALVSADTILIGHSLESDLKALKFIHSTVVDTSLVFPHKMGLPYKRALKNLLKDYCQKIIQDGVDGHDSAEDAKACMELMLYKVKQDLKSE